MVRDRPSPGAALGGAGAAARSAAQRARWIGGHDAVALIRRTLTEFFRELLRGAMRTQEVAVERATEHYLVALLERFAKPGAGWTTARWRSTTWNPSTARGRTATPSCKRVGDTALFLSGMFMESLEREPCRPTTTWRSAASPTTSSPPCAADAPRAATSSPRSPRASPISCACSSEISFAELFRGDVQRVRVYTRWLRTRGAAATPQWLLRHGIVPVRSPAVKIRGTDAGRRRLVVARHDDREQRGREVL